MSSTMKIKRPKFYDYFTVEPQPTSRVCETLGCENPATHVDGYYLVVNRRERSCVCHTHWRGNPQNVLPTPPSIVAALEAERKREEAWAKHYKTDVDTESRVSVKAMAPSGHGKAYHPDRVANWRWGA